MRHRVPLLLCALLCCAVGFGAVPAAGQPDPGQTHLEVQLQDNGNAEWNVTVAVPITDEEDRDRFETFARRFEAGEYDLDLGVDAFEQAADRAAPESDREMEIRSVRRESEIVNETEDGEVVSRRGLLRVRFTWVSFARIDEEGTLYVDDVFNTTGGTWLPGLAAGQSLTIRSPPGYGGPTTSPVGAESGDLHWEGPTTFEPGYFEIVYPPAALGPTDTGFGTPTVLVTGALLLSAAALAVGVYLLISRRRSDEEDGEESPSAETQPADETETVNTDEMGDTDDDATASAAADETEDLELLSDEERVEYLLERNGGRMKQATIVKETGWSNAKVSQLLSSMDEADRIDKLRIGRENLISLPGEGVSDLDSETGE